MTYSDVHIHALFGADDGAKTEEEMYAIVSKAYADGVRVLCCTPHFAPGYFGDNNKAVTAAFRVLRAYVREQCPDMELYLGSELRYSSNCLGWLRDGLCRTLNRTRHILVDFREMEERDTIVRGLEQLLNAGYLPVLAHAERYPNLGFKELHALRNNSVTVQIDTQSLLGGFGWRTQRRGRKILAAHLADIVSSDAHDLRRRPPGISECYAYIVMRWGTEYAAALCKTNARNLLIDNAGRKG